MRISRREILPIGTAARFVVLTGLSGAGKSEAIHALEDLGYFCVDNLPTSLVSTFADLVEKKDGVGRAAVVVDMRDRKFLKMFPKVLGELRQRKGLGAMAIFLEASDEALVRRFSETRRPHPLASDRPVIEGILEERELLKAIKTSADESFDTSDLTVHELRRAFTELSRGADKRLIVTLLSFGYKYGVPLESDLLFDVRFLPNPHFVPALRPLTGKNKEVQSYLNEFESMDIFFLKSMELLTFLIPRYSGEGKSYLTISIGCTGGRHRSVAVVEALRQRLGRTAGVSLRVKHRDVLSE
jgi:UPF0042 nucleotide-binding protein